MARHPHGQYGTFRQFEILLAVHDSGSVTQAAEQLSLTQPSVSMQLKKLADTLDVHLYDQIGRELRFTEPGRAVVAAARDVVNRLASMEAILADLKGQKAGRLRLGLVTTSEYFIPHLLGDFCKRYPEIDVALTVGNRQEIIDRLEQGIDDFCVFSHPPQSRAVVSLRFLPNPLVAIASENHPLTRREKISLHEFCEYPLMVREPGSGTRLSIENHFKEHQARLNIGMTIDSNEAIKHAVMANLGVSIVSIHSLAAGGRRGLVELDVDSLPIVPQWHLARLRPIKPSVIATTFLEFVENEGRARLLSDLQRDNPSVARYCT